MNRLDRSIAFATERFDYTSTLPDALNAGNRFYGRDVAMWLGVQLAAAQLPTNVGDEDWGWLLEGTGDSVIRFEIAVYNVNDHGEGGRPGAPVWGLWIRAFERKKTLGFIPRKAEVPVPAHLEAAVLGAIRGIGGETVDWPDAP
jgi:hypothetical protein